MWYVIWEQLHQSPIHHLCQVPNSTLIRPPYYCPKSGLIVVESLLKDIPESLKVIVY